jgi:hypothetical protein
LVCNYLGWNYLNLNKGLINQESSFEGVEMKKKIRVMGVLLLSIILISLGSGLAVAYSDSDGDNIDDNLEILNKREIDIIIEENEILIESTRKSDKKRDLIRFNIVYNEDGIRFQSLYKSDLEEDFELFFGISFHELIEFIDTNKDGIYNPETDQNIQNFTLSDFSPAFYENSSSPNGSFLHYIKIQTENETFVANIYFTEEFTLIDNSLLIPTQAKIELKISNFNYSNSSSLLALYTTLDSETAYENKHDTEDEIKGYAENEEGVITKMEGHIGFFTWHENASINNLSKKIQTSEILSDSHIENTQKIYFNYPQGNPIYHCYKIGIEGLLIYEGAPPLPLIIFIVIISVLSAIVAYPIYNLIMHRKSSETKKREGEEDYLELFEETDNDILFNSNLAIQILEEEGAIDKLYHKGDINITVVSPRFYDAVNQFDLKEHDKKEFIKEMLSLSPNERELILQEMKIKSQ